MKSEVSENSYGTPESWQCAAALCNKVSTEEEGLDTKSPVKER